MDLGRGIEDAVLDGWPVARLATLATSGRPHAVPVVFARTGGCLWCPIDAKRKRVGELARERNVRAHPEAALLLDEYHEDWQRLWWLRVDGRAQVVSQVADAVSYAAAATALRDKYPQYASTPLSHGEPRLLRVEPLRVRSWCAGPDALERLQRWAR